MARWKELGEVPDSDDESLLDSEDSQPQLPQVSDNAGEERPAPVPAAQDEDIWDIPPSSQNPEETGKLPKSPITNPTVAATLTQPEPPSSPLSPAPTVIEEDSEPTPRAIDRREKSPSPTRGSPPILLESSPAKAAESGLEPVDDLEQDEELARQESARIGRSLRPRKPIQEHPYLLENAQYSKFLKSHGVRPIRIRVEEEARKRAEEDSQEQDYEDDSQAAGGDRLIEEGDEESQDSRPRDTFNDVDELALSSPVRRGPRKRETSTHDVPGSSQASNDELPTLDEIFKNSTMRKTGTGKKRRGSPKMASKQKLPKLHGPARLAVPASPQVRPIDIFDIRFSPPQTSPAFLSATPVGPVMPLKSVVTSLTPKPSSASTSRDPTPVPMNPSNTIDLMSLDDSPFDEEEAGTIGNSDAASSSESDTDIVLRAGRRIRGVLPASWLRLDQHVARNKAYKNNQRRSPDRSPERTQRRGVAQRRQASPKPSNNTPFFFEEYSDDDTNLRSNDIQEIPNASEFSIFDDDAGSDMEDDHIDRMLPGSKRVNSGPDGQNRPTKGRKAQKTFQGQQGGRKKQQRITGMLGRSKSGQSTNETASTLRGSGSGHKSHEARHKKTGPRPATPPRLSILDVIEPDAPSFIRIAARAAKRRPDKGKSSPTMKHISLGTRKDNIDALGVLRNWKDGKIQPRLGSTIGRPDTSQALQSISGNPVSRPSDPKPKPRSVTTMPASRFSRSRKLVKQTDMNKFVTVEPVPTSTSSSYEPARPPAVPTKLSHVDRFRNRGSTSRPAQLEADGPVSRHAFDAKKKMLDALYRRSRASLPSAASTRLESVVVNRSNASDLGRPAEREWSDIFPQATETVPPKARRRFRKHSQPQCLDTTAPQYAHANDPLPIEAVPMPEPVLAPGAETKLMGLGPFGTHYTKHFEIFPLDPGVYFHESTLIGQGRLVKAFDDKQTGALSHSRGHCILSLDGKTIRWGPWDAQTSSEIGVLFDLILDKLQPSNASDETSSPSAVQVADFVLNYLEQHLSLPETDSGRHFVKRMLEIMDGVTDRLGLIANAPEGCLRQPVEVLTRCVVIALQTLRICEHLSLSESLHVEESLKKTAKQTARMLLRGDLEDIRRLYSDLQEPSFRDRGIRNEQYSVAGWVTLMRILQDAHIPRAGFWDIVTPVMLEGHSTPIVDARMLERLWMNLFTLLPLGEFDNSGVAVTGLRQTIPVEGWNLPQKLLSRVFELYQSNQRQSPSFNDYCRGNVSRCHYLVEQWGWRKCNGIIGTIFDFFASQSLSHLRNEEAYKSPEFLDELAGSPSLTVQPEDRCFHIFLKLLALVIKRLRRFRSIKDVKNLVARVTPNHARQYLKEQDIHENELAALRNHHDLLCTLFWSAPADLRPSVQTIENLITPSNAHREACLINLRAWNQVTRFVVSSGEDRSVFKAFADWQNNVFKQVLEQHASVESDIQQQFLRMSKDASSGVSQEMIKRIVNMNKQAATDVLHFSLKATLDVLHHAPSLGVASFVLNTYQLHEVFSHFSLSPSGFDWSTLSVALDVVDQYLTRIERFLGQQVEGSETADSWQGDDSIMLLDRHISTTFFPMARSLLLVTTRKRLSSASDVKDLCLEQMVIVAGRVAALFIHAGVSRLSRFFTAGKYALFETLPSNLPLQPRKYLCLFISTLIDRGIVEFKDIDATRLELFLCSIVKPFSALSWENRLAQAMKRHGDEYLKDAVVEIGNRPDYNSNRDLFAYTMSKMRKAMRVASPSQRQQLKQNIWKATGAAMKQMKQDLEAITDTPEHTNYIHFVRSIIPLIKTNDAGVVDKFFYEISNAYSPPIQDPRLQTAAILSYGLGLEDQDTRAIPELFYFLYPNFKLALRDGKLHKECNILKAGMKNSHILSFMLSRMFPALIRAAVRVPEAWLLLDVYVGAVELMLTEPCIHREIGKEYMSDLAILLRFASAGIQHLQAQENDGLISAYLHTLKHVTKLVNLFGPSMIAFLCLNSKTETGAALKLAIGSFTDFTRAADEYLSEILDTRDSTTNHLELRRLCEGVRHHPADVTLERNEHINAFAKHIMEDIPKTWIVTGSIMSIKGPARAPASFTQSGQGTAMDAWEWDLRRLAMRLRGQLREWNYANDRSANALLLRRREAILGLGEDFMF